MRGVCAFDIDNTLTCGENPCNVPKINYMIQAIQECKSHDMKVVINTARPPQRDVLFGIHADVQKLLNESDVYTMIPSSDTVPYHKLKVQQQLSELHRVPLSNVVLIDDRLDTIDAVQSYSMPGIHVTPSNDSYGIDQRVLIQLQETLVKIT